MVIKDCCNVLENAEKGQLPGIVRATISQMRLMRWGSGREKRIKAFSVGCLGQMVQLYIKIRKSTVEKY